MVDLPRLWGVVLGQSVMITVILVCETCGEPITIRQEESGMEFFMAHNPQCRYPKATIETLNPRRLGVIIGIVEPDTQ